MSDGTPPDDGGQTVDTTPVGGGDTEDTSPDDHGHPGEIAPVGADDEDEGAATERRQRWLGVAAAALLGLATIGTAWGSYQSARWGGEVSSKTSESIRLSTDAGKFYQEADARIIQDGNLFLAWSVAVAQGDDATAAHIEGELFSPELREFVPLWSEMDDRPHSPLEVEAYVTEQYEIALLFDVLSGELAVEASEANEISDDYVLLTVILASVLFLAGLSGTTRTLRYRSALVVGSAVVFGLTVVRMVTYPVLWPAGSVMVSG